MSIIIKVLFIPKKNSPVNLIRKEYFVKTDNYVTAHDKALDQLSIETEKKYLRYYDNVAMCEIDLIR